MVIWPEHKPALFYAYLSSPQELSTLDEVHKDFAIGSNARFSGSPCHELFILDRPEFYNISHLQIRQKLDDEGSPGSFLVIDDRAAESHSVWYVERTDTSESYISEVDAEGWIIKYPGEKMILKMRMNTRDVQILHLNFHIGHKAIAECLTDGHIPGSYDPHADQEPYNSGIDYEKEHFLVDACLTVTNDEIEFTRDPEICQNCVPKRLKLGEKRSPYELVRMKPEIAEREGLLSWWRIPRRTPEGSVPEGWVLQAPYDWNHEKWKGPYQPLQHRLAAENQIGRETMYKRDTCASVTQRLKEGSLM